MVAVKPPITKARAVRLARQGLSVRGKKPVRAKDGTLNKKKVKAPLAERKKKFVPLRKSKVRKVCHQIRVMKQLGGTVRFAKKIRRMHKATDRKNKLQNMSILKKQRKVRNKAAVEAVKGKTTKDGKKVKPVFKKEHRYDVKKMRTFYKTQLAPRTLPSKNFFLGMKTYHRRRSPYLRRSLLPGTVCIILSGRYKCKRVVFLKQLRRSGLCLITGPFGVNAVPMRRMSQAILIATSVRIDMGKAKMPKNINDRYFMRPAAPKKKKTSEEEIFETKKKHQKQAPSAERRADQKAVDRMVVHAIKQRKDKKILLKYLRTDFGLQGKRYAHKLKF
uniref:Large ribosomal subunit protein eL6 n=1 Tax=Hirondellea gigas TaxID=1518452 RepID=A0A6A7FN79_9CRUS